MIVRMGYGARKRAAPRKRNTAMGFWLDLISGRRYPSAYEPLRYVPPEELAEICHDAPEAGTDERPCGGHERLDADIEAGSAA